ncbi:MAG: hypothetical protein Q7T16_02425 [Candidatus Burarchaeum sp.]|nr:hypothetical protein [Candidatus Burarchaeum sp.]MDO8339490.1 hypothetical protein [Candidatus Burarchaeum sp.]
MSELLVRLEGPVEETLKHLVEAGFFKTKNEAVRAGILALGKEYHMIKSREEVMDELAAAKAQAMMQELRSGKKKALTMADVRRKYPEAFE